MIADLVRVADHTRGAVDLFFETSSVLARLEGCGIVKADDARGLGLIGPAGRACGIDCDVRCHYPLAGEGREHPWPAILEEGGDVLARARIRQHEIEEALTVVTRQLKEMSGASTRPAAPAALQPDSLSVALVEGWRGRIAHIAITNDRGRFQRYKVIDPSFFNWSGLAMALRDEQISDFPLCNKSFNLSYCGFDL
jgi:Ni,Fe-hydrogenase III large subunit